MTEENKNDRRKLSMYGVKIMGNQRHIFKYSTVDEKNLTHTQSILSLSLSLSPSIPKLLTLFRTFHVNSKYYQEVD
jgi:hypothetical protein